MSDPPRKPWWKRKRWWVIGLLWLAFAYPASIGPVGFARGYGAFGYNSPAFYGPVLPPNRAIFLEGGDVRHVIGRYYVRWFDLGAEYNPYPILP